MKSDSDINASTDGDGMVRMFHEQEFAAADKDDMVEDEKEDEAESKDVVISDEMKAMCEDMKRADAIEVERKYRKLRRLSRYIEVLEKRSNSDSEGADRAKERLASIKEKNPNIEADLDALKGQAESVRKCRRYFYAQRKDMSDEDREKARKEMRERALSSLKEYAARLEASFEKRLAFLELQLADADGERKKKLENYIERLKKMMAEQAAKIDDRIAEMEKRIAEAENA